MAKRKTGDPGSLKSEPRARAASRLKCICGGPATDLMSIGSSITYKLASLC